jgi:signal peptidase I
MSSHTATSCYRRPVILNRFVLLIVLAAISGCSRAPLIPLQTGSMFPTLERQSECVLQPMDLAGTLKIGHVVTVILEGQMVVRRVAGLAGDVIEPDNGLYKRRGTTPNRTLVKETTMCLAGPSPRCTCEIWRERIGLRDVEVQRLSRKDIYDDIRCDPPVEHTPITVPPGHVFVLADNRDGAFDSRDVGPIPLDRIRARVLRCR